MAKSMLQKLEEDFNQSIEAKIGGHAIGFYSESDRLIEPSYELIYHDPHENKKIKGIYTLKSQNESFFWWDYNPE
jgi:hypothetical protein